MPVRLVLDTDVMVAALRSDAGASRQLLQAALIGEFDLLISVPLFLEYEAVLTRPAHLAVCRLSGTDVTKILDNLVSVGKQVKLAYRWRPQLPDADDDMVLETAINGAATAVVTFNSRDFTSVCNKFGCAVLLPATALNLLRSSAS